MKSILELTSNEAKAFFLKDESYCNIDLPRYFTFESMLKSVNRTIGKKNIESCFKQVPCPTEAQPEKTKPDNPKNHSQVCYQLLSNKDGKYAWRPLQLIHPVLYCHLVQLITTPKNWTELQNRFTQFATNKQISCLSIPNQSTTSKPDKVENILNWWNGIEQESIKLSLLYDYVLITDITDCYGSIYTHSLVWALHGIDEAKKRTGKLLGDYIDVRLQALRYGQTNGIPQGSVLMDFISEILLGYIDEELSKKININDYQILRYRDDYRIFANNTQHVEIITKILTEILSDVGLKLNTTKTIMSSDIIQKSLKPDKLYYITNTPIYIRNRDHLFSSIQHELLFIHDIASRHPNSGALAKLLTHTYKKRIQGKKRIREDVSVLISIVNDIAYKNPRTYSIAFLIISKLLSLISNKTEKDDIIDSIYKKFKKLPNTGYMEIWLQRVTYPLKKKIDYKELLCQIVEKKSVTLWESAWLNDELKSCIDSTKFIDFKRLDSMPEVLDIAEVNIFEYD